MSKCIRAQSQASTVGGAQQSRLVVPSTHEFCSLEVLLVLVLRVEGAVVVVVPVVAGCAIYMYRGERADDG